MRSLGVDLPEQPHQKYTDIHDVLTATTTRHGSPGATLSPGRRGGLGAAGGGRRRLPSALAAVVHRAQEPQTRGTSGLAVGIFNLHFQTPHTRTHRDTKTGRAAEGGEGGGRDPDNPITKQQQLRRPPARGRGCPGGIPAAPLPAPPARVGGTPHAQPPPTTTPPPPPRVRLPAEAGNAEFGSKMN